MLVKVMNQLLLELTPPKLNQHLLIIKKSDDENTLLVCCHDDDDDDNDDDDNDDDDDDDDDDDNDDDDDDAEKTPSEHLIKSVLGPCTPIVVVQHNANGNTKYKTQEYKIYKNTHTNTDMR